VERSCLEFSAKKRGTSLPILSLESARSMAAKGGASRKKLAKYHFVIDTESRRCFWSHDFLQFLKALRFHHNSDDAVIEEDELMILAAENGIDPNDLFPPVDEPDPNANEVGHAVHVPADLLIRTLGTNKPPRIPRLPRPDPQTMFNSTLPLTLEFVRRPPQTQVEDAQEQWDDEYEEEALKLLHESDVGEVSLSQVSHSPRGSSSDDEFSVDIERGEDEDVITRLVKNDNFSLLYTDLQENFHEVKVIEFII